MRINIIKCEARNAVNIENIDKFRNEAVADFKLMDASHDLFRGSVNVWTGSINNLVPRHHIEGGKIRLVKSAGRGLS